MPAAPLIAAGIGAIGSVASAGIQSKQVSKAVGAQTAASQQGIGAVNAANRNATGQLQTLSGAQQKLYAPYTALGGSAYQQLGSKLGVPAAQTVTLRGPDGSIGQVPIARVNDALAAGATRVQ